MGKKVRSIKGQIVDFDLIKIKQQIAAQPAPVNVKEREAFIDKKVRRRPKKNKVSAAKLDVNVEPKVEDDVIDEVEPIATDSTTDELPQVEEPTVEATVEEPTKPTKRKVRKK